MATRIFISYSAADSGLAGAVLDLLVNCEVARREEVFCFEQPGAAGTTGRIIGARIAEALAADVAIALVTHNYLMSNYCIGEFGYLKLEKNQRDRKLLPILFGLEPASAGSFFADVGMIVDGASAPALNTLISACSKALGKALDVSVWERARAHAIEELSQALAEAGRRRIADANVELHSLPSDTLAKIVSVRRERLSKSEREWFYDEFQKLEPQYHVPTAPVARPESQLALEAEQPIDDEILDSLCKALDIELPELTRPIDAQEKDRILASCIKCGDAIADKVLEGTLFLDPNVAKAWRRVYEYLAAFEFLAEPREIADADVVVVPGARKGHVFRADAAAMTARAAHDLRLVVFSGGQPIFDDEQDVPFGEADAMAERYSRVYPNSPPGIGLRVDNRARTTAETIAHMRVHLQPLVVELGRAVNVLFVTSPYHMRRTILLARSSLHGMEHLVASTRGVLSTATYDWRTISRVDRIEEREAARYGVGLYAREMSKLYGGRATGEF